jgi:hypothetical protein
MHDPANVSFEEWDRNKYNLVAKLIMLQVVGLFIFMAFSEADVVTDKRKGFKSE